MTRPRFILWRPGDRRYVPLVVALTVLLAALVTIFFVVFTVIRVRGDSMLPNLDRDDRVLFTRAYAAPTAGDIVSIAVIDGGEPSGIIKRVVAVPGDEIELIGDIAWVNGRLSEAAPGAIVGDGTARLGPLTVPDGTVFVLGDNRPGSLDSRHLGPIPLSAVRGRAVAIIMPITRFRVIDETLTP